MYVRVMMLVASLPLLRLLGTIAALTKDKNTVVELNNVNGGVNELIKKVLFTFVLSLERSIALMTSVDC